MYIINYAHACTSIKYDTLFVYTYIYGLMYVMIKIACRCRHKVVNTFVLIPCTDSVATV